MKLYYSPGASSLAPHIALREAGRVFDIERVDLRAHRTASGTDFLTINPKGDVPALQLDGPQTQAVSTATTTMHEINESASGQRAKNTATAAVLQSYFLKDHLVTTFGVRKDQNYGSTAQYLWDANNPYALPPSLSSAVIPDVAATGSGTTRSYSVVAKVPSAATSATMDR